MQPPPLHTSFCHQNVLRHEYPQTSYGEYRYCCKNNIQPIYIITDFLKFVNKVSCSLSIDKPKNPANCRVLDELLFSCSNREFREGGFSGVNVGKNAEGDGFHGGSPFQNEKNYKWIS